MITSKGYAAQSSKTPLQPFSFERRDMGADDVLIDIKFCGVCHSDIHQARDEWGGATYPMVPGHEIVGAITNVGASVKNFKVGDLVGVGCFVDSCRTCGSCKKGLEQYCDNGFTPTYNGIEKDKKTPTFGGYSSCIVVDQNYVLRLPKHLDLSKTAPLLCAGITTYSPLRHCGVTAGHKVAVIGLGGLGHMGVKLAHAMGAEVTVLSTSESKRADAEKLGADHFVISKNESELSKLNGTFDFILNTVSAPLNLALYLELLKTDGTLIVVGAPEKPMDLSAFSLIMKRRRILGSLIGGIKETQEMLDFCGQKEITSDVEVIPVQQINEAYTRMLKGDVKYRFVIDMKSL